MANFETYTSELVQSGGMSNKQIALMAATNLWSGRPINEPALLVLRTAREFLEFLEEDEA